MLSKRIFAVLLTMMLILPVQAQIINVMIYKKVGDAKPTPASNVTVWSFLAERQAKNAKTKLMETDASIGPNDGMMATAVIMGSQVQMRGDEKGYFLIDDGLEFTEVVSCKGHIKQTDNGPLFEYTIVEKNKKSGNGIGQERQLDEVTTTGKRILFQEEEGADVKSCGGLISYSKTMHLSPEITRTDARYGVVPLLVEVGTDSAQVLGPAALDGEEYHRTMHRRMGYLSNVLNNEVHDTLGMVVVPNHFMRTRQSDSLRVRGTVTYDESKKFNIVADVWMEDYNSVFYRDRVLIWDGNSRQPQRYLDWKGSVSKIEMDSTKYRRDPILVKNPGGAKLQLKFEQGDYKLNMKDSITVADLDKIVKALNDITRNPESSLTDLVVKAYSSPEGSSARNKVLSHQRNDEIRRILRERVRGQLPEIQSEFDANDNIYTWDVVANELDSLDTPEGHQYAAEVRDIVARKSTMDAQYQEIRANKARYDYINQNILPNLRPVFIEYKSIEYRIIPFDETYAKYQAKEDGYYDGSFLKPYQFYHLMTQLYRDGDWEGLERISRKALESTDNTLMQLVSRSTRDKAHPIIAENDTIYEMHLADSVIQRTFHKGDTIGFNMKNSADYYRPYDLAAYYLSECLLHRAAIDTKLLKDYIDDSSNGLMNQKRANGRPREWWNDEAIVMNQILMLCDDNKFQDAYKVANNHLPKDDPRFTTFRMMLKALNCQWDDPDVVTALSATTPMNACAVYIAQNKPEYYLMADTLLQDTTKFNNLDARTHYLRAICRFHAEEPSCDNLNRKFYDGRNVVKDADGLYKDWAAPMLQAFKLDPTNVDYIKTDGYFNDAYRSLVLYFWKRMNDGVPMETIAEEYNALAKKYSVDEKK